MEEQQGRGRGGKRVGEVGKDERESGLKRERVGGRERKGGRRGVR